MLGAIRYNLANLTRLEGRDARSTFWFYVLFLAIVDVLVSIAAALPMIVAMASSMFEAIDTGASEQQAKASMMSSISSWYAFAGWMSVILSLTLTLLLVASLTRRAHDSDKSGYWVGVLFAIKLVSIVFAITMIGQMREIVGTGIDAGSIAEMQAQQAHYAAMGLLGWVPLIGLVVIGLFPSSDGTNRFGEEPEGF